MKRYFRVIRSSTDVHSPGRPLSASQDPSPDPKRTRAPRDAPQDAGATSEADASAQSSGRTTRGSDVPPAASSDAVARNSPRVNSAGDGSNFWEDQALISCQTGRSLDQNPARLVKEFQPGGSRASEQLKCTPARLTGLEEDVSFAAEGTQEAEIVEGDPGERSSLGDVGRSASGEGGSLARAGEDTCAGESCEDPSPGASCRGSRRSQSCETPPSGHFCEDPCSGAPTKGPSSVPSPAQTSKGFLACSPSSLALSSPAAGMKPLKFMTWNANSLLVRLKNNCKELSSFVARFDPDYIALQEVRMPAAGKKGCPLNQGDIRGEPKAAGEEKQFLMQCLQQPPFSEYRVWWSLGETKYAGTAVFVKRHLSPISVTFSLEQSSSVMASPKGALPFRPQAVHEKDGRAILVRFPELAVLNTYVPNNGFCSGSPGFERRRQWDARMLKFLEQWNADAAAVPLLWCGDLNISPTDDDVSHPEFFRTAMKPGEPPADDPDDRGQPAFSVNERKRFRNLVKVGDLCDAYRMFQPTKDMACGFTWSGNPVGMYQGKRMRVDHFLLQRRIIHRAVECRIHGRGIQYEGTTTTTTR